MPSLVGSEMCIRDRAYTHVAHDCELGNHVILANAVNMGGHVIIQDWAIVGGMTPVHQFVRIGAHAFVGGGSRITKDIPPYCRAAGSPPKLYGLNSVGLERRGVSLDVRRALKKAYRKIFQSDKTISEAVQEAGLEVNQVPEVGHLVKFIQDSERGVTT